MIRFLTAIPAIAALSLAACNECSFGERCDGNTRQVCGEGADQLAGRTVREFPCDSPNDTCTKIDLQTARCVVSGTSDCTPAHRRNDLRLLGAKTNVVIGSFCRIDATAGG